MSFFVCIFESYRTCTYKTIQERWAFYVLLLRYAVILIEYKPNYKIESICKKKTMHTLFSKLSGETHLCRCSWHLHCTQRHQTTTNNTQLHHSLYTQQLKRVFIRALWLEQRQNDVRFGAPPVLLIFITALSLCTSNNNSVSFTVIQYFNKNVKKLYLSWSMETVSNCFSSRSQNI